MSTGWEAGVKGTRRAARIRSEAGTGAALTTAGPVLSVDLADGLAEFRVMEFRLRAMGRWPVLVRRNPVLTEVIAKLYVVPTTTEKGRVSGGKNR